MFYQLLIALSNAKFTGADNLLKVKIRYKLPEAENATV